VRFVLRALVSIDVRAVHVPEPDIALRLSIGPPRQRVDRRLLAVDQAAPHAAPDAGVVVLTDVVGRAILRGGPAGQAVWIEKVEPERIRGQARYAAA